MQGSIRSGLVSLAAVLGLGVGVILSGGHGISPQSVIQAIGQHPGRLSPPLKPVLLGAYGKLPLSFEANRGQADPEVRFLARGKGYTLFLTATETVLSLPELAAHGNPGRHEKQAGKTTVLRVKLVGGNPEAEVVGLEELPGKSNYFIGNEPSKWRTNVSTYAKVEYRDVYPGINLVHYGNQRQLEYDFVVSPGADPRNIKFEVEGTEHVEIDAAGDLVLHVAGGEVRQRKPIVYQEVDGERHELGGRFVLRDRDPRTVPAASGSAIRNPKSEIAFEIGSYDPNQPLVVDPVLVYSTYLGASGGDEGSGIAADSTGNAYVTGFTNSTNFPTASPLQAFYGGGNHDAFVAKLNPAGSALVYSTYLGGSGDDAGFGIGVDSTGNAYVTGWTSSTNFPTASPLQAAYGGGSYDAFVVKLNAAGSALVYSTYLGGSGDDRSYGIAVDSGGSAYVTGYTSSTNFPLASAIQAAYGGGTYDAFVAKLNAAGSALLYSTYLGGSGYDYGYGIAVDPAGNAYVTGYTNSTNFPTASPLQATFRGSGIYHAFVTKLSATGQALVYSTYLGGSGPDVGEGIAADSAGNAYVTGWTASTDFPLAGALQSTPGGSSDVFVTKLNAAGSALLYSTYLGGAQSDDANGIAVDSAGNAYVTGYTSSTNFPVNFPVASPLQAFYGGGSHDAFVTKLNAAGSALLYSTYLGGSGEEYGRRIALDPAGNVYITGVTGSANFLTVSPFQAAYGGSWDAFIAKIDSAVACTYSIAPASQSLAGTSGTGSVTVTAPSGCTWTAASNASWITITSGASSSGNGTVNYTVAANSTPNPLTGTLTIAGQTMTISQAASCSTSISPTSASLPWGGGTGSVTVTTGAGCPWTAASNASWITITSGASGSGNGTVSYSVAPNTSVSPRTGTLTIAGQTMTISQAASCSGYSISHNSASLPWGGGTGTVTVTAATGCTWTAASNASWITITSGSSGNGSGTVGYSVAANRTNDVRTGNLTIAGLGFVVTQAATGLPMITSISPTSAVVGGDSFVLALKGRNFVTGSVVHWNQTSLPTTFVSTSELQALVSRANLTTAGNIAVTVSNPGTDGGTSDAFTLPLMYQPTKLSLLVPSSLLLPGADSFVLTVKGGTFLAGSVIRWNGSDRPTVFVNSGELQALISASDVANPGTVPITVFHPLQMAGDALNFVICASCAQRFPSINASGIVNGASFNASVAGGSIGSVFGTNLASSESFASSVPLPTTLGGGTVQINGIPAPLFYVSPAQINFQVPWELLGQSQAWITVTLAGVTSAAQAIKVAAFAPGLFAVNSQGTGQGAVLIAATGEIATPLGSIAGRTTRPVQRGEYLSIYCTGLGPVANQPVNGAASSASPLPTTMNTPTVTIGGVTATVSFSGLAPGFVALYQVNVRVPDNAPTGNAVSVVLTIGGATSNTVTVAVQ